MESFLVLVAAIAVPTLFSVLVRRLRLQMIRRASMDEHTAMRIRGELLDYVKANSFGEGQEVNLGPFLRKYRLGEANAHLVVDPLFDAAHLLVRKPVPAESVYGVAQQVVERWIDYVFMPLTQKVVLNPQLYYRMLHEGLSGTMVMGNVNIDQRRYEQSITAGDGARVNAGLQGDSARMRQDVDQSQIGLSGGELADLASLLSAALTRDAENIDRAEARDTVLELAREAEHAAAEPDRGTVMGLLRRARDGIRLFGSGMEETRRVVDQFGDVLNQLS